MKILFLSYTPISLREDQVRTVATLRTLADAGYKIDLIAPSVDLKPHANIRIIKGKENKPNTHRNIQWLAFRSTKNTTYSAIHAIDETIFFAYRLSRQKKIPLIYDARRRFTGKSGRGTLRRYRFFPKHYIRLEKNIIEYAACVFSLCPKLTTDLTSLSRDLSLVEIKDIPLQPLCTKDHTDRTEMKTLFPAQPIANIVTCYALSKKSLRNLMLTARKIIDTLPETGFFLKTTHPEQAKKLAKSLDIVDHCCFLQPNDPHALISALSIANVVLYIPPANVCYIPQSLYTALNVFAPLVVIQNKAYELLLTKKTAHFVLANSDAMAEGLLDILHEPLFSVSIATEGQELVRSKHTFSSFKHQIRMTYKKFIPSK